MNEDVMNTILAPMGFKQLQMYLESIKKFAEEHPEHDYSTLIAKIIERMSIKGPNEAAREQRWRNRGFMGGRRTRRNKKSKRSTRRR